jgi:putative tricarboxylic transport membrane protein
MLLSALEIHGVQPGPMLMVGRPQVFWGVVASMYIGNVILLLLNLPLVRLFVSILQLPQHVLGAIVLLLCLVGAYSLNNSLLDLWVLAITGALGYWFRRIGADPAPLVVALVLGPLLEKTLRQALFMANGEVMYLVSRPLTVALLLIVVVVLASSTVLRAGGRLSRVANVFREETS